MVIFPSILLSVMISNDLILPVLLKRASQVSPNQTTDFTRTIPKLRRAALIGILLVAFAYQFTVIGHVDFTGMALISAIAMMQLLPPFLGALFWRRGTARGAIWGMLAGFCVWVYTMVLPTMLDTDINCADGWSVWLGGPPTPRAVWPRGQQLHKRSDLELIRQYDASLSSGRFPEAQPRSNASRLRYSLRKRRTRLNAVGSLQPSVTVDQLKTTISKYIGNEQTDLAFQSFHKQENIALEGE